MKTTQQVIHDHNITNPTDAALIRLAGEAAADGQKSPELLLSRELLESQGDKSLAAALIDVIRANAPTPTEPVVVTTSVRPNYWGWGGGVVVLIGTLFLASQSLSHLSQDLATERLHNQDWAAKFETLQNSTTAALAKSGTDSVSTVNSFASFSKEQTQRTAELVSENEKLKQENAGLRATVERLSKSAGGVELSKKS